MKHKKRPPRKPGWLVFEVVKHVGNIRSAKSIERTDKRMWEALAQIVECKEDLGSYEALHSEKIISHKCGTEADWPEEGT